MLKLLEQTVKVSENLASHAEYELRRAGLFDVDSDYGGAIGHAVMELMRTFSGQGHSGFSAGMVRELFDRLSNWENLTSISDNKEEWNDVSDMGGYPMWQSKRNPSLFSEDGGKTYYSVDDDKKTKKKSTSFVVPPVQVTV